MYFPKNFCNVGGKSFDWVFDNKKGFVEHTVTEMTNPTGLFLEWQNYYKSRIKKNIEK